MPPPPPVACGMYGPLYLADWASLMLQQSAPLIHIVKPMQVDTRHLGRRQIIIIIIINIIITINCMRLQTENYNLLVHIHFTRVGPRIMPRRTNLITVLLVLFSQATNFLLSSSDILLAITVILVFVIIK